LNDSIKNLVENERSFIHSVADFLKGIFCGSCQIKAHRSEGHQGNCESFPEYGETSGKGIDVWSPGRSSIRIWLVL
jgi:hypothetical protein